MPRTVFVANIPYDVSEEQIATVFSEVGPVSNVEIKFDAQGRSKGYAFVQYYDEATALSALRNLQEVPINGRPVRIELSTEDGPRGRRGGPAGGAFGGRHRDASPPRTGFGGHGRAGEEHPPVDLNQLPPGQELGPGQKATDAISKTLADVNPGQMQEVMASVKNFIATQPEQARQLLTSRPQLAYALFQAMLLMNIVDPSVLQRIQPLPPTQTGAGAGASAGAYPPPAGNAYPPYQAQNATPASFPPYPPAQPASSNYGPPAGAAGYNAPPPAPAPAQQQYGGYPPAQPAAAPTPPPLPPSTQAALAGLPEDQRAMLVQVLQLTQDQINALDPTQQASVKQLRQQFLGAA